jgi:hypothetical protein
VRVRVRMYVRACACPGPWACTCASVLVALLIQHAMRMRHIVTSFVAPLAPPRFSALSHKRYDFRKNVIEHKMCVLIFSTIFVWNSSHCKNNSERYCHKCENVFMYSTRYSCRIVMEFEFFSTDFRKKNRKYQMSSSSVQWEASCCMWADARTWRG